MIHGAPASGKLAVAMEVAKIVSGRIFDNHSAIDIARTIFEFGAPGFWSLVHSIRLIVLDSAFKHSVPIVVMTYCYSGSSDGNELNQFEEIVHRNGGIILPVFLSCSERELIRRIDNADRVMRGKISTVEELHRFLREFEISAIPRDGCLHLDAEANSARVNAFEICRHFQLIGTNEIKGSSEQGYF
ncbi:MAG: hypothetical protein AAF441_00550 [Pseudomonadota bacterium]